MYRQLNACSSNLLTPPPPPQPSIPSTHHHHHPVPHLALPQPSTPLPPHQRPALPELKHMSSGHHPTPSTTNTTITWESSHLPPATPTPPHLLLLPSLPPSAAKRRVLAGAGHPPQTQADVSDQATPPPLHTPPPPLPVWLWVPVSRWELDSGQCLFSTRTSRVEGHTVDWASLLVLEGLTAHSPADGSKPAGLCEVTWPTNEFEQGQWPPSTPDDDDVMGFSLRRMRRSGWRQSSSARRPSTRSSGRSSSSRMRRHSESWSSYRWGHVG